MASAVERCFFLHIHGGGSRRHGAVEAWRQMCGEGHAQEVDVVWRRGGINGRGPAKARVGEVVVWHCGGIDGGGTCQGWHLNLL